MNFFKENKEKYILLNSNIKYSNNKAYISLIFLNIGELKLKSTNLITVGYTSIHFIKDNENIEIPVDPISEKEVRKLQLIFKEAVLYEASRISLDLGVEIST